MVLVTGGAGYVGSHVVKALVDRGRRVVVYDDLSRGHREALPGAGRHERVHLIVGDIRDEAALTRTFRLFPITAVVHLAGKSLVEESVRHPEIYYLDNLAGGFTLLRAMRRAGMRRIVFSSSAAVYGEPRQAPIREDHPLSPTSPYGRTKLAFEQALADARNARGLNFIAFRYFNAAGADAGGDLGEDHQPETHLIPRVLQVALGQASHIRIFGRDCPSPDGTCVRDFVHVSDLAEAHALALTALETGHPGGIYNLGSGTGHSVRQVVEAARRATGHPVPVTFAPRRPGDPAVLVASPERAAADLGWRPRYTALDEIIRSAWRWHQRYPHGYATPSRDERWRGGGEPPVGVRPPRPDADGTAGPLV